MLEVSAQNFEDTLKSSKFVLVDFWAPWCGPCKNLAPLLEELESVYGDKVLFAKVDIDQNQEIAFKYKVFSIPNVRLFKDGELAANSVGFKPKKDLEKFLNKHLEK